MFLSLTDPHFPQGQIRMAKVQGMQKVTMAVAVIVVYVNLSRRSILNLVVYLVHGSRM